MLLIYPHFLLILARKGQLFLSNHLEISHPLPCSTQKIRRNFCVTCNGLVVITLNRLC